MQLKKLYIVDYKILKDFTYEFPSELNKRCNVLIGANGSGKSTVIEALAEIFSCTLQNKKVSFGFSLSYSVNHEEITEIAHPKSELSSKIFHNKLYNFLEKEDDEVMLFEKTQIEVINDNGYEIYDGDIVSTLKMSLGIFTNEGEKSFSLLPTNIITYYSGVSTIIEEIATPHNKQLSDNIRKGKSGESILFYNHQPELFNSILTCLLSFEFGDVPKVLQEKAKIIGFKKIQFILKKPYWAKKGIKEFWGAEGEVRTFLDYLLQNKNLNTEFKNDSVIIEIGSQQALFEIRGQVREEKELFKLLYTMFLDDLMDDISIELIKEGFVTFDTLSEGEQQTLSIKGLTELLAEKNTLFLLDEPDTYLHPKWQRQFINEIEESIEQNPNNEISYLIATHSSQILSNANPEKTFVKIIEDGQLIENTPKHYGREISSILYNLMGVEERNKTIRKDLSNLFTLIEDEEIEEAEKEFARLTEILGETDPDVKNAELQIKYLKEDEADN